MMEPFLWSLLSIYLRGLNTVYVSPVKVCAITVHSLQKPTHLRVFLMRESPGDAPALAYPTLRAALGLSLLDKRTPDIGVAVPGSGTGGDGVQLRTSLPAASGRGKLSHVRTDGDCGHKLNPGQGFRIAPSAHRTASAPAGKTRLHSPDGRRLTTCRCPNRLAQDRGRQPTAAETGSKMAAPETKRKCAEAVRISDRTKLFQVLGQFRALGSLTSLHLDTSKF